MSGKDIFTKAEITFPCNYNIVDNPYSFIEQIERTKAALDAGFQKELLTEITRLKRVHFSSKTIGNPLETGKLLDDLYDVLYKNYPRTYGKRTLSYMRPLVKIQNPIGQRNQFTQKHPKWTKQQIYCMAIVFLTLLGFAGFMIWLSF